MRIVVDTNVLLAALPKASRFRFIITYDGHFNVMKTQSFPTIGIVNPDELLVLLTN